MASMRPFGLELVAPPPLIEFIHPVLSTPWKTIPSVVGAGNEFNQEPVPTPKPPPAPSPDTPPIHEPVPTAKPADTFALIGSIHAPASTDQPLALATAKVAGVPAAAAAATESLTAI